MFTLVYINMSSIGILPMEVILLTLSSNLGKIPHTYLFSPVRTERTR